MKVRWLAVGAMTGGLLVLGVGCVTKPNSSVDDSGQLENVTKSQRGEVLAVRDVLIKAPSQTAGRPGMGARIGSVAGRSAVPGSPGIIAGAVGAVVGEAAGSMAGTKADDKMGEEITVLVDGGKTVMIVQERGSIPLASGEKVRIVTGTVTGVYGGRSPVTRVVREEDAVVGGSDADRVR